MSVGFGADTWCLDTLQPGRLARDAQLVVQALYRRATTPRGTLRGGEEESVYGYDLSELIGAVGGERAARIIPSALAAEFRKDDRVAVVTVTVARVVDPSGQESLTVDVAGVLEDDAGDFAFTLVSTAVTTALVGAS